MGMTVKRLVVILFLLLGGVLVACTAPAEPDEAEPAASSVEELPEVLLTYSREGGIAGFCDTLVVREDEAYWENCTGQSAEVPIDETVREELISLALQYAAFEEAFEDNPGGADSLQQVLEFEGIGSEEPTEEMMVTLSRIAGELIAEAMQSAPTSRILPYLGV